MIAVEPRGTGMALFTLRAAEEVRAAQFGVAAGELGAEMVAIAKAIIAQRTGSLDDVSRSLPGGLARTARSQDEGAHR
jgi:non-homologous end joining protein Ku